MQKFPTFQKVHIKYSNKNDPPGKNGPDRPSKLTQIFFYAIMVKTAKEEKFVRYQAVLFDFDYTLGDATESIYAAFVYALTAMGYPKPTLEAVRQTVGMLACDAYTLLSGDPTPQGRDRFYALFHPAAHQGQANGMVKLFPGALELLEGLKAVKIPAALVSSKNIVTVDAILDSKGIRHLFAAVVGGNAGLPHKPHPAGTLWALEQMGVAPQNALYCGDTVIDAQTAQNAGCDFSAVLNGTTPAQAFDPYPHVHIAPDLRELKTWLNI